jgi:hypothetical protein
MLGVVTNNEQSFLAICHAIPNLMGCWFYEDGAFDSVRCAVQSLASLGKHQPGGGCILQNGTRIMPIPADLAGTDRYRLGSVIIHVACVPIRMRDSKPLMHLLTHRMRQPIPYDIPRSYLLHEGFEEAKTSQ